MSAVNAVALLAAAGGDYQISRSVRLRSSASAYFNRTPASAGTSNKTFTYSGWVKRGSLGSIQNLISSPNTGNSDSLRFSSADQLEYNWQDTVVGQVTSTQVFRDPSAWYHIVFAMDTTQATAANRFKLYINGVQVTSFATANYPAQNTVVNNTAAVATKLGQYANASSQNFDGYLTEVNFIDGQALTPSSFGETDAITGVWKPKKYAGTYGTNGFYLPFSDNSSTTSLGYDFSRGTNFLTYSEQLDNAIWVQSGVTVTANAGTAPDGLTTADKVIPTTTSTSFKELQQGFSATSGLNYTFSIYAKDAGYRYVQLVASSGSLGSVNVNIDLQTGTETAFSAGTSTVVARSITSVGSGWYRVSVTVTAIATAVTRFALDVIPASNSARGVAWSGDGTSGVLMWGAQVEASSSPSAYTATTASPAPNNWTPNNISVTAGVTYDSMIDVPTMWADGGNGRGNYAVLNRLSNDQYSDLTEANLALLTSVTLTGGLNASIGVSSGKWYWETTVGATGSPGQALLGIRNQSAVITGSSGYPGGDANGYGYYASSGNKYNANTGSAYGASYTSGDVIGVAFDADAGTLTFYKNNTSQGVAFSSIPMTNNTWFPAFGDGASGSQCLLTVNFGQRPFAYTPPTGFKALNTQNLPDATIKAGNKYMDVSLYTGNGSSQSITNSGAFQPDLVWTKGRSGVTNHSLVDSVRGSSLQLSSNQTIAEVTDATEITAFNSNGFSVGNSTGAGISTNANGTTYVGWQWKKGATQGFDIVTYTGTGANRTVAHSLGVAPRMMIVKRRSGIDAWPVYHANLTSAANTLILNSTAAQQTVATYWNSTAPTSSVFSLGTDSAVNANAETYVAYLFAEVAGFSKFGSYTGNGSTDGPFVYLGFRAKYILIKRTDSSPFDWYVWDSARNTYNLTNALLQPDASAAEVVGTDYVLDILANGFKIRNNTAAGLNPSGGTMIYAAFAENPFKNSLAR